MSPDLELSTVALGGGGSVGVDLSLGRAKGWKVSYGSRVGGD